MVTIEGFLKEEINDHSRKIILDTVQEGKKSSKEKDEIVFNRFSIEIYFFDKKVLIYDDIFSEDRPIEIQLSEFMQHIKNNTTLSPVRKQKA